MFSSDHGQTGTHVHDAGTAGRSGHHVREAARLISGTISDDAANGWHTRRLQSKTDAPWVYTKDKVHNLLVVHI